MDDIIKYNFNSKDGLVIEKGKWFIRIVDIKINQDNEYKISLNIMDYSSDIPKDHKLDITLPSDKSIRKKQPFIKVNEIEFRIINITPNIDFTYTLTIEFKSNACLQCKNKYIDKLYFSNHFCSQYCFEVFYGPKTKREEISSEDERELKKRKVLPEIDILLIGTEHGEKEELLNNNLVNALNLFVAESFDKDTIMVLQKLGGDSEYKNQERKPFLVFWEHKFIGNDSIPISNINGKDSFSFSIPVEHESITWFQFIESAFYLFLYPVNFDEDHKPEKMVNEDTVRLDNSIAISIYKYVLGSHGLTIDSIEFDKYGLFNPCAIQFTWIFLRNFVKVLNDIDDDDNNNNTNMDFLFIILHGIDKWKSIIDTINDLVYELIQYQLTNNNNFNNELTRIINENIEKRGGKYEQYMKSLFVKKNFFFKNNSNMNIVIDLVSKIGKFDTFYDKFKYFLVKFWYFIGTSVNTNVLFNNDPLKESLNFNIIINDKIDNNIENINNAYFLSFIKDLKESLSIDIPTILYFKNILLNENGLLKSYKHILLNKSPFVQLRNIIALQNITNICLSTGISRCIVLYGNGHKNHLYEIINKQKNVIYNMQYYDIDNDISIYPLLDSKDYPIFSNDVLNFLKTLDNNIILYFILEKIDYWLWLTDQFKSYIRIDKNPINKKAIIDGNKVPVIIKLDHPKNKLQIYSNLISHFLKINEDIVSDDIGVRTISKKQYYIIGYYLYNIINSLSPTYELKINNYYVPYYEYPVEYQDFFKKKLESFLNFDLFHKRLFYTREPGHNFEMDINFESNDQYSNLYDYIITTYKWEK